MSIPKQQKRVISQVVVIDGDERDLDQAWFWSKEWNEAIQEAEEDIRMGRVETFDTMEEFLATLDD